MDFSIFDSFDMSVFTFFGEQIQSATMNIVAEFITFFGGSEFVMPMAVLGLVLSFFKRTRKFGMAVLFAVLVGTLLTNVIFKPMFDRPRPYVYYAEDPLFMSWYGFAGAHVESDKSFPSGHTVSAMATAFTVFSQHKKLGIVTIVMALLMGLSRLYVGVHFPTDVYGGIIVAFFISLSVIIAEKKLTPIITKKIAEIRAK